MANTESILLAIDTMTMTMNMVLKLNIAARYRIRQ
jgi:hypothetical protein